MILLSDPRIRRKTTMTVAAVVCCCCSSVHHLHSVTLLGVGRVLELILLPSSSSPGMGYRHLHPRWCPHPWLFGWSTPPPPSLSGRNPPKWWSLAIARRPRRRRRLVSVATIGFWSRNRTMTMTRDGRSSLPVARILVSTSGRKTATPLLLLMWVLLTWRTTSFVAPALRVLLYFHLYSQRESRPGDPIRCGKLTTMPSSWSSSSSLSPRKMEESPPSFFSSSLVALLFRYLPPDTACRALPQPRWVREEKKRSLQLCGSC